MAPIRETYLLMTLDPVHVGTGGYRLGRVDLSVVREPGEDVPKIPGTALAGAIRAYAACRYEEPHCAGQGQPNEERGDPGHCGQPTCPICYTFGHTAGERSYAGTVRLFDARLLIFPISSMAGPVWVSTEERLNRAGFGLAPEEREVGGGVVAAAERVTVAEGEGGYGTLSLGWLLLRVAPQRVQATAPENWLHVPELEAALERLVLVDDGLFPLLVNANLEVRTSVSIDPTTGAAEHGALFTYEAIPRAVFLTFDAVEDEYRQGQRPWSVTQTAQGNPLQPPWNRPLDVVRAGLDWAEMLGVGGMGTRGFGRVRLLQGGGQ